MQDSGRAERIVAAMVETKAQRTLVKSPPELWAELSDPATLARHLGELDGEIRITRVEPETTVVWEGERATGTVELAPSGWGTKVTLSVSAPAPADVAADGEIPPAAAETPAPPAAVDTQPSAPPTPSANRTQPSAPPTPSAATNPESSHARTPIEPVSSPTPPDMPKPAASSAAETTPSPDSGDTVLAQTPAPATPDEAPERTTLVDAAPAEASLEPPAGPSAPKRGFFARLFGRRHEAVAPVPTVAEPTAPAALTTPPDDPPPDTRAEAESPAEPQPQPHDEPEPPATPHPAAELQPQPPSEPAPPVEPDPPAMPHLADAPNPEPAPGAAPADDPTADPLDPDRASELLAEVLDKLGAAHHRPFSRA